MHNGDLSPWVERAWIGLLQVVPLRAYSRMIRVLADIPLPRRMRRPVFGRVASGLGMDMTEAEGDVTDYRSFGALFTRRLIRDSRPVDPEDTAITSPVDGSLSACGTAREGSLIQAKGIDYPLEDLLRSAELARELHGGPYVTVYLQPRDYHRIHSPVSGTVVSMRRIGGTLFPVKPYMVRNLKGLFTRNERVVLEIETAAGKLAMVLVAAAGVGNISTAFDADGDNGRRPEASRRLTRAVVKGEDLAAFNLGSTVILVFAPGTVELEALAPAQPIRMGQRIARRVDQQIPASASGR